METIFSVKKLGTLKKSDVPNVPNFLKFMIFDDFCFETA